MKPQVRLSFPHGHRKTATLAAGLRTTATIAPLPIDRLTNVEWFQAYVSQVLAPTLKQGTS